jgi:metal-responsive CopG/Arc/MetJ family transcriptional regulator
MKQAISITIEAELLEYVDEIAGRNNTSRSEVIEWMIKTAKPPDPTRDAVAKINAAVAVLRELDYEVVFDMKKKKKEG